jgi:hypothetical protein
MKSVEVRLVIRAPMERVLEEFSDYTHAPILHKGYVESVRELQRDGNTTVALWRLKVLGVVRQATQRQTVMPPDRMANETIDGFARGTVESTFLEETGEGTAVYDRVDVRVPGWGKLLEVPVAWYTRRLLWKIFLDHKSDLESRYATSE